MLINVTQVLVNMILYLLCPLTKATFGLEGRTLHKSIYLVLNSTFTWKNGVGKDQTLDHLVIEAHITWDEPILQKLNY